MRIKSRKRTQLTKLINKKHLMWLLAALFLGIQVLFTIQTASSGAKLADLEKKEGVLVKRSQDLSRLLVKSSSLSQLEKTADELGFIKPVHIFYISKEEFVAKLP